MGAGIGRCINFNPRSPWGERLAVIEQIAAVLPISIHAPRGGSDFATGRKSLSPAIFQSTLPVGGATPMTVLSTPRNQFQSTLPVGGATVTM